MSKYRVTDAELISVFEDDGIELTEDPEQAIFALRMGTMISGECDEYGQRSIDHNVISDSIPGVDAQDPEFWPKVHEYTGIVRLVPETNTALVMEGQKLTDQQADIVKQLDYAVEPYVPEPEPEDFSKPVTSVNGVDEFLKQRQDLINRSGIEHNEYAAYVLQYDVDRNEVHLAEYNPLNRGSYQENFEVGPGIVNIDSAYVEFDQYGPMTKRDGAETITNFANDVRFDLAAGESVEKINFAIENGWNAANEEFASKESNEVSAKRQRKQSRDMELG